MGYIEDILTQSRDASVKSAAHTDQASKTGDPTTQYTLMLAAIDRAVEALDLLREARRNLVGGMSND